MEQVNIERINELTRLSRERELTEAEKKERAMLREAYIASMKQSLSDQIDRIRLVDEQGNQVKVRKKDRA